MVNAINKYDFILKFKLNSNTILYKWQHHVKKTVRRTICTENLILAIL